MGSGHTFSVTVHGTACFFTLRSLQPWFFQFPDWTLDLKNQAIMVRTGNTRVRGYSEAAGHPFSIIPNCVPGIDMKFENLIV